MANEKTIDGKTAETTPAPKATPVAAPEKSAKIVPSSIAVVSKAPETPKAVTTTAPATTKEAEAKTAAAPAPVAKAPEPAKKAEPKKAAAKKKTVKKVKTKAKAKPKAKAQVKAKAAVSSKTKPTTSKTVKNDILKDMEKAMTQNKAKFDTIAQDLADTGRENFEIYYKSYGIFVKGLEDLAKAQAGYVQSFAEKQAEVVNKSFKVKTLNELSELQNTASQEAFNDLLEIATKTSEQYVKVVTESFDPLNEQLNKTIQKVSENIAA